MKAINASSIGRYAELSFRSGSGSITTNEYVELLAMIQEFSEAHPGSSVATPIFEITLAAKRLGEMFK